MEMGFGKEGVLTHYWTFFCQVLKEPAELQSEELHFLRPGTQKIFLSFPLIDEWGVGLAAYRYSRAHFSFKFKCL